MGILGHVVDNPVRKGRAWTRILVTLALLAVFGLAARLPLPGTDTSNLERWGRSSAGTVMALGIAPFFTGFVAVELWTFVLPMGRKLRRGGIDGRSKLKTFAIRVGLAIALLQAVGIATALQQTVAPGGASVVLNPGFLFILSSVTTLVAGAALAFLVAKLISRWGVGNGFCLIILLQYLWPAYAQVHKSLSANDLVFGLLEVPGWLAAIGLLVWRFALGPQAALRDPQQETIPLLTLPAFPQGILPVLWAYSIFNFLSTLTSVHLVPRGVEQSPIGLLLMAVLIAAFSLGAFLLFSGRERLERNLPLGVLPPKNGVIPRQSLLQSTALLVVFGVSFPAGEWLLNFLFPAFWFPTLAMVVAFGFDLIAEWRFRQRHGDWVACLIEMDNVYFACYLNGLLAKRGFDSFVRAFHFRSLMFDLGPIIKMELIVPAPELERAQEIIRPERIEIV